MPYKSKEKKAVYNKQYRASNRERISNQKKEYRKNNPLKIKNSKIKTTYGITLEDYNRMFAEQNGKCCICGIHASELKGPLQIDHIHANGKVRGLLCNKCNVRLGEGNINKFNITNELYSKALGYITIYNN
jgi:hypothetical protein